MKRPSRLVPALLAGIALLLSACVIDGGHLHGGLGVHYGPFSVWFQDLPWLDVRPWWHGGVQVRPPPLLLHGPGHPPHLPGRPRPHR
jgi:hypothetical protein